MPAQRRQTKHPPLRRIVEQTMRRQRGIGWYTHELLECGHSYETDATGAAVKRAKRRRCSKCWIRPTTGEK